jgi:protein-tyrosine phosphatase
LYQFAFALPTRLSLAGGPHVVLGLPHTYIRAHAHAERRSVRRMVLNALAALVVFLVVGNLVILAAMTWARQTTEAPAGVPAGVRNYRAVDETLVRGAAPSSTALRSLAAAGVTTVVDLRAERELHVNEALLAELGLTRVHLPIRDGQTPTAEQVDTFLRTVEASAGKVFVHCGAGVGRTGSMVAAYLVSTGKAAPTEALRRNLSVGPPSLEQITYAARLDGSLDRPHASVTAVSRVLDAPRRLWSRVRA